MGILIQSWRLVTFTMKFFMKFFLIGLIALPFILTVIGDGPSLYARAEDVTDEEEEIEVEAEGDEGLPNEVEEPEEPDTSTEEDEESTEKKTQGSTDIDLSLLFTKPVGDGSELPAGKVVEFLVGIINSGDRDYIIDGADASFRYPQDYNYHIQNFSRAMYGITVRPAQEASVLYSFAPADVFAGRPLGLQINLAYHDADGQDFIEAVFNSTVNITEVDEGFDTETFFMYIFLLAFLGLLGFLGYGALDTYVLGGAGKKAGAAKKLGPGAQAPVELGTAREGVDYEWLPEHLKSELKRKVNGPTRTSPRLRKP